METSAKSVQLDSLVRILRRLDSIFSVDPNLAKVPPEIRQAAVRLLNRVTNGVDMLLSLRPTPKGWKARFLENRKPVEAEWDGRELVTILLSDLAAPGDRRRRDARKNCVKGRWCVGKTGRGTCIAANKKCRQQLKEQEMAEADRLSEALRQAAAQPQSARKTTTTKQPQTQSQQSPELAFASEERDWGQKREPWMEEAARELRVPPALVENVFRVAEAMGGRNVLVYLNELRKKFPDIPRDLMDDVLFAMHKRGKIVLMELEAPLSITPEIKQGAIKNPWISDELRDYYVLRIRNL
jgi:hypothetical protein